MSFVQANLRLTDLRTEDLIRRVPKILTDFGKVLDLQLKEEIQRVQFEHPRETRRRNGATVGSPRDIVDTGAFLRSQRRQRVNLTTIRFTWGGSGGVTYAGNIFEGVKGKYDGKDWIKPALKAVPLESFFAEQWKRLSAGGL